MTILHFVVPAVPVPQPRQRHRIVQKRTGEAFTHNYTPEKHPVQAYKAAVMLAAKQAGLRAPLDGPIRVDIDFYLPRPKRLMRKKDPDGPILHAVKPDRDNLEKSTTDALKGLAWRDDSQICDGRVRKWYSEKNGMPRVEIRIERLSEEMSA